MTDTATQLLPEWMRPLAAVTSADATTVLGASRNVGSGNAGDDARRSAVLLLFGEGVAGPDVLLTERGAQLRSHPGQVAFPGGTIDATDDGPVAAALREAAEEAGVMAEGVQVVGVLSPLYLAHSNHDVTPVIAWWRQPSPIAVMDPIEVSRVLRAPLRDLIDPANRFTARHPSGFAGPAFEVGGLFVWGFTAGLLAWVLTVAGLDRPWDASRIEDVPA